MRNFIDSILRMSRSRRAQELMETHHMDEATAYALMEAEQDREKLEGILAAHAQAAAEAMEEVHKRAERNSLGRHLGLGVPAVPALALTPSGLTPNSNGAGTDSRSVTHLKVLGAFTVGRLSRDEGDVLCRPSWSPWMLSEQSEDTPLTCPRCQAILARLKRAGDAR